MRDEKKILLQEQHKAALIYLNEPFTLAAGCLAAKFNPINIIYKRSGQLESN